MKIVGSLFAVLVMGGLVAGNQDDVKSERPIDKDFLIKVASCNHCEIQVSKLADKQSESTQIKEFATMIMKEHKEVGDKLAELSLSLLNGDRFHVGTLTSESSPGKRLDGLWFCSREKFHCADDLKLARIHQEIEQGFRCANSLICYA